MLTTKLKKKDGVTLLITFIFLVALVVVISAYAYLVTFNTRNIGAQINSKKAFYLAEAGLNKAVWYLINTAPDGSTDGSWRTSAYPAASGENPTDPKEENLGDGTYTVWVEDAGSNILITSEGIANGIERTISQEVAFTTSPPEAFQYSSYSGSNINLHNSNGTITGDIAVDGTVSTGDITIDGTTTEGSTVSVPSVDLASYEAIADHNISGNYTFLNGQTYSGVWYIDGKVTIQDNVTINGSIISTGKIDLGSDLTINPSSPNPAIVTSDNINGNNITNVNIAGLLYAGGNISLNNAEDLTIEGAIVAGGHVNILNGDNITIIYDPSIFTDPPPYFSDGGSGTTTFGVVDDTWKEI